MIQLQPSMTIEMTTAPVSSSQNTTSIALSAEDAPQDTAPTATEDATNLTHDANATLLVQEPDVAPVAPLTEDDAQDALQDVLPTLTHDATTLVALDAPPCLEDTTTEDVEMEVADMEVAGVGEGTAATEISARDATALPAKDEPAGEPEEPEEPADSGDENDDGQDSDGEFWTKATASPAVLPGGILNGGEETKESKEGTNSQENIDLFVQITCAHPATAARIVQGAELRGLSLQHALSHFYDGAASSPPPLSKKQLQSVPSNDAVMAVPNVHNLRSKKEASMAKPYFLRSEDKKYFSSIVSAIVCLQERGGSPLPSIKKMVRKTQQNFNGNAFSRALMQAVADRRLVEVQGRYKLRHISNVRSTEMRLVAQGRYKLKHISNAKSPRHTQTPTPKQVAAPTQSAAPAPHATPIALTRAAAKKSAPPSAPVKSRNPKSPLKKTILHKASAKKARRHSRPLYVTRYSAEWSMLRPLNKRLSH